MEHKFTPGKKQKHADQPNEQDSNTQNLQKEVRGFAFETSQAVSEKCVL